MSNIGANAQVRAHNRLVWLDMVRLLAMLEIIGFHWLRTSQENPAFNLTASPSYENTQRGLHQLAYLLTDRTGFSPSSVVNNVIGVLFAYGWEAVNLFVLLSGLGLAMTCNPTRAGFTWRAWYARRLGKIIMPYYLICFPLVIAGMIAKHAWSGQPGLAGSLATKLAVKNLPDPLGIELLKHLFLFDPRKDLGVVDFFSPAWWFIPPILFAYVLFPAFFWMARRCGTPAFLAIALCLSVTGYSLTNAGLLWEHGWYFVVLHEAMSFACGIVIGRALAVQDQALRITAFLQSAWALPVGAMLMAGGNVANWYSATEPASTWIFALGFAVLLARLAMYLVRFAVVTRITPMIDSYHIYLLHQFLAFPLVATVVLLCGRSARSLGFSIGFLAYMVAVLILGLGFERLWSLLPARGAWRVRSVA